MLGSNLISLLFWLCVNLYLVLWISELSDNHIILRYIPDFISAPRLMLALFSIAYFGAFSVRKIDIAHRGVLTFFGLRLPLWVSEGWTGVGPRPILALAEVDMRPTPLPIEANEVVSKDNIEVRLGESSITYQVSHPYRALGIGVDLIGTNVHDLVLREQRRFISERNVENIQEAGMPEVRGVIQLGAELATHIETKVTLASSKNKWGIEVVQVSIPQILPPDDVLKAAAQIPVERRQREAETTELHHVADRVAELKTRFPEISTEEAIRVVQSERDKMKRSDVHVTGESVIERAAGIIHDAQTGQESGKGK